MLVPATSAMICSKERTSTFWNDSEIRSPVYCGSVWRRSSTWLAVSGCSSSVNTLPD